MTPITSDCDRRFRASRTSGTREPRTVRWIVLHDEEASTAESSARFFTTPQAEGSAHLCVDDTICYRTLENEDIPWAAASSFRANTRGFHIEMAGFAKWSAVIWTSHRQTLRRAAYKTAAHCLLFNVRPVFVTAANLPLHGGVTTHNEVSKASRRLDPKRAPDYSHSDPGAFWPRNMFMRYVREYHAALNV